MGRHQLRPHLPLPLLPLPHPNCISSSSSASVPACPQPLALALQCSVPPCYQPFCGSSSSCSRRRRRPAKAQGCVLCSPCPPKSAIRCPRAHLHRRAWVRTCVRGYRWLSRAQALALALGPDMRHLLTSLVTTVMAAARAPVAAASWVRVFQASRQHRRPSARVPWPLLHRPAPPRCCSLAPPVLAPLLPLGAWMMAMTRLTMMAWAAGSAPAGRISLTRTWTRRRRRRCGGWAAAAWAGQAHGPCRRDRGRRRRWRRSWLWRALRCGTARPRPSLQQRAWGWRRGAAPAVLHQPPMLLAWVPAALAALHPALGQQVHPHPRRSC